MVFSSNIINVEIEKGKLIRIKKYLNIFDDCKHDSYISHGEVISGRATSELKWAENIIAHMRREFIYCIVFCEYKMFEILFSGELIGFATIKINKKSKSAILLDIMIKRDYQSKGIGREALHKIEKYLRKKDIKIIILESGIINEKAHLFFEKNGYTEISLVYSKSLSSENELP